MSKTPQKIKEQVYAYRKTKAGLTSAIYGQQRSKSKKRNHLLPSYDLIQFRNWIYSQSNFETLYNNWMGNGYKRNLRPSVDRIKDDLPYSINNIQLMTWKDNNDKGHNDMKSGKLLNGHKAIKGIHIETGKIIKFVSIRQASRKLNINHSNIIKCCNNYGYFKSIGGYKWEYINN